MLSQLQSIEAASRRAWSPHEALELNGWLLRFGRAKSRRLNSAQTLEFGSEIGCAEAIGRVEAWYAERGFPACFQLCDDVHPAALDEQLADRGYTIQTPTSVMTCAAERWGTTPAEVELYPQPNPEILDAVLAPEWSEQVRRERLAVFERIQTPVRFGVVRRGGALCAAGLCVADGAWAGIFGMRTRPEHRGHGLARLVLTALCAWARRAGAPRIYLQVEDDNPIAQHLYRSSGFERAYGYHYRERTLR